MERQRDNSGNHHMLLSYGTNMKVPVADESEIYKFKFSNNIHSLEQLSGSPILPLSYPHANS